MDISQLNWLAILVATVAAFALGGVWYGPVFGKAWQRLVGISDEDITGFNIPTGIPIAYDLDDDLQPRSRDFLGDADAVAAAAAAVAAQGKAQ